MESGFGQGPIFGFAFTDGYDDSVHRKRRGMRRPRLLSEGSGQPEQSRGGMPMGTTRAMSEETARWIQRAMVAAVERGTARPASLGPGWIAGKTGTAETAGGAPHSWFVGSRRRTGPDGRSPCSSNMEARAVRPPRPSAERCWKLRSVLRRDAAWEGSAHDWPRASRPIRDRVEDRFGRHGRGVQRERPLAGPGGG